MIQFGVLVKEWKAIVIVGVSVFLGIKMVT